ANAVMYSAADMSKPDDISQAVSDVATEFGALDILVNNAGIQHVSSIENFSQDRWDAVIAINLSAVFHATKAALPGMRQRKWGRIINIASVHGLVASPQKAAYVAAKHGVMGLTKVTALETAGSGVTCNAICPGWVMTPLVEKQILTRCESSGRSFEDEKLLFVSEKMPSGEPATPEQIAALAVFLCSDAAAQISGTPLPVDGGWTAQ
ncbi:MAG: 3-hydroxybutyrate dehydrogenase, partial [Anaerolineales bacterium]|nr:3-hydroxybutyrate dehydrogenase [Anaerolineales bacterium]